MDLELTNRVVDMVDEGFDVGVRVARALDGRFVARPLARTRVAVFGAPEYFGPKNSRTPARAWSKACQQGSPWVTWQGLLCVGTAK